MEHCGKKTQINLLKEFRIEWLSEFNLNQNPSCDNAFRLSPVHSTCTQYGQSCAFLTCYGVASEFETSKMLIESSTAPLDNKL